MAQKQKYKLLDGGKSEKSRKKSASGKKKKKSSSKEPATITISSMGDCTLGTDESFDQSTSFNAYYNEYGADYFFKNVRSILEADDLSVVNFEGTLNDVSTLAHELGHYISFTIFLRQNNLNNITFVTEENEEKINNVMNDFDTGEFSLSIIYKALENYNNKYNLNLNIEDFALTISKYAGVKDKNGNLIADETIAEAIHDYYLHKENMKNSSYEIIQIIKQKL